MPQTSFPPLPDSSLRLFRTRAQGSGAGTAPHCAGAVALLSHFPATIKLDRRSIVCTIGHLVPERTDRAAHGVYGALVIPSQSDRVPPPSLSGPASHTSGSHTLVLEDVGCYETQGALRH